MPKLSDAGSRFVQELSQRHGVSTDAATHMLIAVQNGNGSMAQFSHPEFGGSGQWMRGGMTMVSDLFNHQLKSRVDNICNDIANELAKHQSTPFSGSFQSQSQNGTHAQSQAAGSMGSVTSSNSLFVPDPASNWWPNELGAPSAIGSQNNVRYAYFAPSRRLAVTTGRGVWVYDTQDHHIGGFSQQQGMGGSITFTSQYGTVDLSRLPVVSRDGVPQPPAAEKTNRAASSTVVTPSTNDTSAIPTAPPKAPDAISAGANERESTTRETEQFSPPGQSPRVPADSEDIIGTLERLGGLVEKGYLTEEEFAAKKADLLSRL